MCSLAHSDAIHLGMDVHKDSISVGILRPGDDTPDVEKIFHDEESVRPLVGRFPEPGLLRTCYEAGPTGYGLCRLLVSLGARCEVIAPSMIPKARGDKVTTDTRDCRRLARSPRWRAGRDQGAGTVGRSGSGPVPHPGRHGPRPDPGPESLVQVLAAPLAGMAGHLELDPRP